MLYLQIINRIRYGYYEGKEKVSFFKKIIENIVLSIFRSKKNKILDPITTDIHSHLLPGLDDGVKTLNESIKLIKQFIDLGYSKIITTPHIMSDYYKNSSEQIKTSLTELNTHLRENQINIQVEAAAEYYLDEDLITKLNTNEPLLTFGSNYLLFELNFLTEPFQLKDFIFLATTQGYKPVLAHPERYPYLINNFEKVEDIRDRGVLFQINVPSILGAYSKLIQRFARQLIKKGWVDFLGSDCHNQIQFDMFKKATNDKYFKRALQFPLLNRNL